MRTTIWHLPQLYALRTSETMHCVLFAVSVVGCVFGIACCFLWLCVVFFCCACLCLCCLCCGLCCAALACSAVSVCVCVCLMMFFCFYGSRNSSLSALSQHCFFPAVLFFSMSLAILKSQGPLPFSRSLAILKVRFFSRSVAL